MWGHLWVLNGIITKKYPENMKKKIMGAVCELFANLAQFEWKCAGVAVLLFSKLLQTGSHIFFSYFQHTFIL